MRASILHTSYSHTLSLVMLALLEAADVLTTHLGLAAGLPEANPLPAFVLAHAGEAGLYGVKILAVLLFVLALSRLAQRRQTNAWRALTVLNVLMLGVVLSNLVHLPWV